MKYFFLIVFVISACISVAQDKVVIDVAEVSRIENILAADDMQGRRAGTPGIDKAAAFIASEFKRIGLQPVSGNSYLQEFSMIRTKQGSLKFEVNDVESDAKDVIVVSAHKEVKVNEKSGYPVDHIRAGENLGARAQQILRQGKSMIVLVDTSFTNTFGRLTRLKNMQFKSDAHIVFILRNELPKSFTVKSEQQVEEVKYANVVGVLPGNKRANEIVIFSGHYDHMGIGKPVNGDSIYNGANDDAAGTTAVIMLADHFKKQNNNERTIVFAAFTAEEVGGFGSQYFSRQYDPSKIVAMFNIEMIGTESKWGKNSAYITGYDETDMGKILQENLKGSAFSFHPDPYTEQNLFYRSDNATLARLGVAAHTISTAKMEAEPNYHKVSDEVSTLDLENMTAIIRAIAVSASSIISGKATPSRVNTSRLK